MIRLPLLGLLALVGCEPPIACDTMAVASVNLTIMDANGAAVPGVVATFDLGNGPEACQSMSDTRFFCGMEQPGTFAIHVEAPGFQAFDQEVVVENGECHVIPQALEAVLEPVECTQEVVPSVIATVVGSSGEDLSGVKVEWGLANADMMPVPCEDRGDGNWACGEEQEGDLEVTAVADGHGAEVQTVTVGLDEAGCHVLTQTLQFDLDWLPD